MPVRMSCACSHETACYYGVPKLQNAGFTQYNRAQQCILVDHGVGLVLILSLLGSVLNFIQRTAALVV